MEPSGNSGQSGKRIEYKVPSKGKVLVYRDRVEVLLEKDTVWLNLNQMADLFERDKSAISRHLRNIFKGEELIRNSVVAKIATTAADGKIYQVEYFNLDAIISVGYRVNTKPTRIKNSRLLLLFFSVFLPVLGTFCPGSVLCVFLSSAFLSGERVNSFALQNNLPLLQSQTS